MNRPPSLLVSSEEYLRLLDGLKNMALNLNPAPQCVVGMKRSGLFPAVFISHQLELPMLAKSEIGSLEHGKFDAALLVDTTAWKGKSLRKAVIKLEDAGVSVVHKLAMYARRDPPPDVPGLMYLKLADAIPRFWYE